MPDLAPNHAPANFTETTSTLTNTTVSIAANANRRGLIIGNPSDTTMYFRVGGTASATAGVPIPELDGLVLAGARPAGDRGAADHGVLRHDVHFNGWVAAGVQNHAPVNFEDRRHCPLQE